MGYFPKGWLARSGTLPTHRTHCEGCFRGALGPRVSWSVGRSVCGVSPHPYHPRHASFLSTLGSLWRRRYQLPRLRAQLPQPLPRPLSARVPTQPGGFRGGTPDPRPHHWSAAAWFGSAGGPQVQPCPDSSTSGWAGPAGPPFPFLLPVPTAPSVHGLNGP